jgi:CRP/FNR family transcriptional regulator, anaerobic regulatory protein
VKSILKSIIMSSKDEKLQSLLAVEMCITCPTRDIALFADVKAEDLHDMDAPIHTETFEKGEKLYGVAERADHLYTLHDGVVKLQQELPTGEQRIVRLLKRGDLAGIEAVTSAAYQHDAIAMTDVKACRIPAEIVIEFSAKSNKLQANLMNKWQHALATSDAWITRLSTGPSRYRVIRLLIWLAETCSEEKFILPGRKDMGSILALTTETVSRLIAELRRDGLLNLQKNGYATADIGALKRIVREGDA